MPQVGIVPRLALDPADVLHNLVLSLARHLRAREDDLGAPPVDVLLHLPPDVVVEELGECRHELGAGRDAVGVKWLRGDLLSPLLGLHQRLGELLGRAEAALALLVHLGAGGHPVDGHVQDLAGADDVEDAVDVLEDGEVHLLLGGGGGKVLGVAGRVDDAVHIQVEVVIFDPIGVWLRSVWVYPLVVDELRHRLCRVHDGLGIPLHQPSVQPGHTHPALFT
mmetsp:Transcript_57280/g.138394  ORF Transcript_57280/g.138394 Transcript_57280/m.138394 type:complete len:222 (+) Transcript_57280:564-1229(+)